MRPISRASFSRRTKTASSTRAAPSVVAIPRGLERKKYLEAVYDVIAGSDQAAAVLEAALVRLGAAIQDVMPSNSMDV